MSQPLWTPSPERVEGALITRFAREAAERWGRRFDDYQGLHRWSLEQPSEFWGTMWDFGGIIGDRGGDVVVVDYDRMPGATWFPDARLNFAENLLRRRDDAEALVFRGEGGTSRRMSFAELHRCVARAATAFARRGLAPGDRVAGFMPNVPETVAAMLAAASLGAVWSSCSPDFGLQGVLDRFGQIEPKMLVACDGYYYNVKRHDRLELVAEIAKALPTVEHVIVTSYDGVSTETGAVRDAVSWSALLEENDADEIEFFRGPFDHPLYVMFSSGTTGVPKCIVHGAGGTLIQHLKEHQLHFDVKPDDRVFYFTTCGWMMWNWLVTALASEATVLLYDGSPFRPPAVLFDFVDDERMTHFGTSAKYIDAARKVGLKPIETHDLGTLRAIASTGSPLLPESFDWVYEYVKHDVCLSSISGGTDIISCFVGGNPTLPVHRGEIQCVGLGMSVEVFDDRGRSIRGDKGELVCTRPFPSMPTGFWNDGGGARYHAAYFDHYPGVWRHGDWVEVTENDGMIMYGRSDAVLNPGGVRIGTAEIYRVVEQMDEVIESIAVGQEWDADVRVVLFVKLAEGVLLDDELIGAIKTRIRAGASPRHVPAKVLAVDDIPRTKSGKITELAVRDTIHGRPIKNTEALANPEALKHFANRAELES